MILSVKDLYNECKTQIERGNGLPSIYEQYTCNKINKLIIRGER